MLNQPSFLRMRHAVPALALLALLAVPGHAQRADEGVFDLRIDGQRAGTEEFSIRQTGAETVATGRIRLRTSGGTLDITPRLRTTGSNGEPVAYQVDVDGDNPRKIVGSVGGGRFSARISSPAGEQLREFVASTGAVVLDEDVAHHYALLAERRPQGRLAILVPRNNRQVLATVQTRGEESIEIAGQQVRATHLVVRPDGAGERHVWVDGANRVLRVEIPERSYVATRTTVPR